MTGRTVAHTVFFGFSLALAASAAWADPLVPPPPAQPPAAQDVARAKQHYQLGARFYQEGQFDKAAPEFVTAYELSGKGDLLYNIAVCYDSLRDDARARAFYAAYLAAKPEAPDRETVEAKIAVLDRSLSARAAGAAPVAPPPGAVPTPAATPLTDAFAEDVPSASPSQGEPPPPAPPSTEAAPAPPLPLPVSPSSMPLAAPASMPNPELEARTAAEQTRHQRRRPAWIAAGIGGACLAGSAVFFALASGANDALHGYPPSPSAADADVRAANQDALIAGVLLAGAVAGGALATVLFVRASAASPTATFAAAPVPGGAAFALLGRF